MGDKVAAKYFGEGLPRSVDVEKKRQFGPCQLAFCVELALSCLT